MKRRSFLKMVGAASVAASLSPADALAASAGACNRSLRGRKVRVDDGWDVIVIGGGPSGCTAAVAAARGGAKTLLIESTGVLGGMGTSGLLNAWCPFSDGERIVYKGLAERVFRESKKGVPHVKGDNWVPINCEQLKIIYDDLVLSYGVKVLFFSTMAAVEMKNDRTVDCVIVANKAGLTAYKAKTYIDCTGDGDLAAWAGADFVMGDEDGAVQAGSLCFDVANVNQKAYRTLGSWRQDSPIYQIAGNPEYPLIHDAYLNDKVLAPGVIGFNAGHIKVDSTDPESVTAAMMEGRKIAAELHRALKDLRPEAFKDSFLVATASSMGIRESRRVLCDYTFVTEDWLQRRDFEDNIGRNCYYIDVHKKDFGGNAIPRYKKGESHGIPYRCLTPIGLDNVIVAGRCISTDQATLGSLRVMPPAMVTGEAAGVAASLACRSSKPDFHSVDVKNLQEILLREGQLLYL